MSKVSIDYPASWTRLPQPQNDPEVALLVADTHADVAAHARQRRRARAGDAQDAPDRPQVHGRASSRTDPRAKQLVAPVPVVLGGLPGWRYRYTFGSGADGGAHDHYFLFKGGRMIQLVFQAAPASQLPELAPTFDRIAATFKGRLP